MPTNTNYNDSKQHCGLYKPPHLRKGYVNNAVLQKNNSSKYDLNNLNDFKDLKVSNRIIFFVLLRQNIVFH